MSEQLTCTWCGQPMDEETITDDGAVVTDAVPMVDPEGVTVLVHFRCAAELHAQELAAPEPEPRQPDDAPATSYVGDAYEAWYFAAAEAVDPDRRMEPMELADAIRRHVGPDEWDDRHRWPWAS